MEDFSEDQKARAIKFVQTYVSEHEASDAGQLRPSRPHFTEEELEGECLQMARTYLSGKYGSGHKLWIIPYLCSLLFSLRGCPGILSYHISHHAVKRVAAGSMEGLWKQEPQDREGEKKPEEGEEESKEGEKEELHCKAVGMMTSTVVWSSLSS